MRHRISKLFSFVVLLVAVSACAIAQPKEGDVLIAVDVNGSYSFVVTQDTLALIFEYAYQNDGVDFLEGFSLTESGGLYFLSGHGSTSDASISMAVELEEMEVEDQNGLWLTVSRGGSKQVVTCKATNCEASKCDPVIVDGSITDCQPPCVTPATCDKTQTMETTTKDWWEYVLEFVANVIGIGWTVK